MKREFLIHIATAAVTGIVLVASVPAGAQEVYTPSVQPQVRITDVNTTKTGEVINLDFTVDYDPLLLTRDERLVVTPMIVKGRDTVALSPVVFLAENQTKKESRLMTIYGDRPDYGTPYSKRDFSRREMRVKNRELRNAQATPRANQNRVSYSNSVPYRSWMEGSQLLMNYEVVGCCDKSAEYYSTLGPVYEPVQARVLFLVPEVDLAGGRSEAMTARIIFQVDKYDIRPELYDNAAELRRIYAFTHKITDDQDVRVTRLRLKGYASPEASWSHNDRLSRNRMEALGSDLAARYNIDRSIISVDNVPEDWDSVRSWVASSDNRYRDRLLDIIDGTPDPDARDAKIKALDNGSTYNYLLRNVYPGLRRVDYEIDYTIDGYTVERGREIISRNPERLTVDQLHALAMSYQAGSPEYEDVYLTAVRIYPDDPVCNHNLAAVAISKGDYAAAKRYMEKCRDYDFATNNMGVLYIMDNDYERGSEMFRKAIEYGSAEARFNYDNLYMLK